MSRISHLNFWPNRKVARLLAVVFMLVLVALILPRNTQATGADTFQISFKGQSANASFFSTDASGCVGTFVSIFANDGSFKETGMPKTVESGASIFIDQFDSCTQTSILFGVGIVTLAADEFQIDKKLDSAMLNTTIEVFDFVSNTSIPIDITLNWTGIGGSFRSKGHFQAMTPGFKVNSHFDGTQRNAEASATVTDGTTNFTPEPAFADLASNNTGEVRITHF